MDTPKLQGFIQTQHLQQAEEEFPGITAFLQNLQNPPKTFLQLLQLFLRNAPIENR